MTKDQLQKELKDKVKPGIKPSHLKKLKRSKSADDIPPAPPLPNLKELQDQVQFHSQTAQNYLKSLQTSQAKVSELEEKLKNNPPTQLLQEQLNEKQQQIETLKKQLEKGGVNSEFSQVKNNPSTELDQSLISRHQSLKDWFTQYKKNKSLEQELAENIDEASTELINQDQTISQLRSENRSLTKDLQLTTKLAESRKVPYYSPEDNWTNLKYVLYSLVAVIFTVWLTKSFKNIQKSPNHD